MSPTAHPGIMVTVLLFLLQLPSWLVAAGADSSSTVRMRLVHTIQDTEPEGGSEIVEDDAGDTTVPAPKVARPAPPRAADATRPPQASADTTAPQPRETTSLAALFGLTANQFDESWVSRAPNMHGNFFLSGPTVFGSGSGNWMGMGLYFLSLGPSDDALLLAGGAGRLSVADNNSAVARDRVYFQYHHFHNALESDGLTGIVIPNLPDVVFPLSGPRPVDRYMVGAEKSLWDGALSTEIRIPWTGMGRGVDAGPMAFEYGEMGNLSFILKGILYESERHAVAMGLGIEVPTGSDAELLTIPLALRLHNEATYLVPYLAVTGAPTERFFCHGFAQANIAASGNSLTYVEAGREEADSGILNQPNLLQLSLGSGYWLYQNPRARLLRGLAASLELHYTSTLNDSDEVATAVESNDPIDPYQLYFWTNSTGGDWGRRDLLDLTFGLHGELAGGWIARAASSLPLRSDRAFDGEIIVQVEKRF